MVVFEKTHPKISSKEIDAFESRKKLSLPESYKQFLLQYNGGQPKHKQFTIPDLEEDALVAFLYGIRSKRIPGDLEYELQEIEDVPKAFLPIGHDPGGNILLLGLKRKHKGQVFYWDSSFWFDASDEEGNTYYLAGSIDDFLKSLRPADS